MREFSQANLDRLSQSHKPDSSWAWITSWHPLGLPHQPRQQQGCTTQPLAAIVPLRRQIPQRLHPQGSSLQLKVCKLIHSHSSNTCLPQGGCSLSRLSMLSTREQQICIHLIIIKCSSMNTRQDPFPILEVKGRWELQMKAAAQSTGKVDFTS